MKPLSEINTSEYMSRQTVVVDDTARLSKAIRMMDDHSLSAMPVVNENGTLVGILSVRDLIEIVHEIQADLGALPHVNEKTRDFLIKILIDQGDDTKVSDVMTFPVETISPETNLVVAAKKMSARKFHHLPVADPDGFVVGILSTSDFVRAIAENNALAVGS